VTTKFTAQR